MRKILIGIFFALSVITPVQAKEISGMNLPDTIMAGKEQLILNGAELRKKLFVKVYAGGLYLRKKEGDAQKIINADEPMAIRMHFIYDGVSSKKLVEAWNEGFADNATTGDLRPIQERIDTFNSFFTEEARKGDIYDIIYTPEDGVRVYRKEKLLGTVSGLDFKKALFAIWLGGKPVSAALKQGMLGT
ncbi:MAG: chalcone isomerase family protein [Planctomycetia bacterium]|nr:chalcone isomerase family protein [Planctomycetia bacterium]